MRDCGWVRSLNRYLRIRNDRRSLLNAHIRTYIHTYIQANRRAKVALYSLPTYQPIYLGTNHIGVDDAGHCRHLSAGHGLETVEERGARVGDGRVGR